MLKNLLKTVLTLGRNSPAYRLQP